MLSFLTPKFIKEFDKTLVLNYPFWYIVKIHYIFYFTLLMWLLSYGIGCILPIDITSYDPEKATGVWTFLFSVLGVILFCIWLYYLTIYNNEDHFGKFSIWDDTKMLFILLVGINLIMSFSYPMNLRVKNRIANSFTDTELAKHYNSFNLAHKYVTSTLNDFQYCGYNVHDTVNEYSLKLDTNAYGETRYRYDLSKYKNFVALSPEEYGYDYNFFFFSFPKYYPSTEFTNTLLTSNKIEKEYLKHTTDADKLNAINNYLAVVNIYKSENDVIIYDANDYLNNYNLIDKNCTNFFPEAKNNKDGYTSNESGTHYLPDYNRGSEMLNIYKAKFALPFMVKEDYLLFAFYFSFSIALFVILFRNNRWQHFLISIVSFILLSIIVGIISLILSFSSSSAFPSLSILIYFSLGAISIVYYFKKDKYNIAGAVATNLFYFGLPFMPLFLCFYAHEVCGWLKCYDSYASNAQEITTCMIYRQTYEQAIIYAQIIGITAFVFVAMPFYKLFFAHQKALPRDK